MADLARLVIHRGNDPFTPPQMKVEWTRGDLGIPSPTVRWRHMYTELTLIVKAPDEGKIKEAVQVALQQAAIKSLFAGLVAGYLTGGTAAVNAAAATFINSLDEVVEAAVGKAVDTAYEIFNESHWGDYQ